MLGTSSSRISGISGKEGAEWKAARSTLAVVVDVSEAL